MSTDRRVPIVMRIGGVVLRPLIAAAVRCRYENLDRLPREGGYLVVGNHISNWDPIAYGHAQLKGGLPPRFLAKASLFDIPILGTLLRATGQIPVFRGSAHAGDALAPAETAIARGQVVTIFPEGTLTRDPDGWPMRGHSGAARIAHATRVPVIPMAVWGSREFLPRKTALPRILPRKTVRVSVGRPIDLSDFLEGPVDSASLHRATTTIMDAVTELVEVVRGEPAPSMRGDGR